MYQAHISIPCSCPSHHQSYHLLGHERWEQWYDTSDLLYLASSLETVIMEPALYKLLTFHDPNLVSIFCCLGNLSNESVQVRGFLEIVITIFFYGEWLLAPRPTPKLEDDPLSFVRGCLFSIFAATLGSWRTCHAVVTGSHLTWVLLLTSLKFGFLSING
jgi:hypothetical protein